MVFAICESCDGEVVEGGAFAFDHSFFGEITFGYRQSRGDRLAVKAERRER